ncbi:MAG: imidazolonepropionase, partial [Planctomycetota bacterium]
MQQVDVIIKSRGTWLTLDQGNTGPRCGAAMSDLVPQENWALAVKDQRIAAIGPVAEIEGNFKAKETQDWGALLVMPGLIDPHTHPVFLATREDEFEMRNGGKSYVEIALAGGGIRSSVRSLRSASEDELTELIEKRADGFLALGTTTIEAKSGYGLSTEDELKSLRAIRRAQENHVLDLEPTFLGAHEIPDEYRDDR